MWPPGLERTVRPHAPAVETPPCSMKARVKKMADRPVFLYAAVYDNIPDAESDFLAVFDLHAAKAIGTFDAAVVEKRGDKVHVHKAEKPTQHGAWTGIGVGALVGILFPPSIIGSAIVGGTAGGVIEHLRKGM